MSQARKQMQPKVKSHIPEFKSREEEAAFWDMHDITDYQDELTTVPVRFAKNLSEGITVRLSPEALADLRSQAKERGVAPAALVRTWIHEHLGEKGERLSNQ